MAKAASRLADKLVTMGTKTPAFATRIATQSWNYSRPRMQRFWECAKVELAPPTPKEWSQVNEGLNKIVQTAKTQKWKELTVKETFINGLVVADVVLCFYIGEILGRTSLIGYDIKGATYYNPKVYC